MFSQHPAWFITPVNPSKVWSIAYTIIIIITIFHSSVTSLYVLKGFYVRAENERSAYRINFIDAFSSFITLSAYPMAIKISTYSIQHFA